jgi:predicted nucleic acid-binding protein
MPALLDTSVIIDLDHEEVGRALPLESGISAISLAELAVGPLLAADPVEAARRQFRLQQVEATFAPLPFDAAAARAYAQVVAATQQLGRTHRNRVADLMIAAVALSNRLDLYTRNIEDFEGLDALVTVVRI